MLDFLRGFVRPFIAYVFGGVFAILAILAFNKFGDANMAGTLIAGFIGIVGTVIGFYFMARQAGK